MLYFILKSKDIVFIYIYINNKTRARFKDRVGACAYIRREVGKRGSCGGWMVGLKPADHGILVQRFSESLFEYSRLIEITVTDSGRVMWLKMAIADHPKSSRFYGLFSLSF
jgi:hypothetical protein